MSRGQSWGLQQGTGLLNGGGGASGQEEEGPEGGEAAVLLGPSWRDEVGASH